MLNVSSQTYSRGPVRTIWALSTRRAYNRASTGQTRHDGLQPEPQPTVKVEDASKSLRTRKDGNQSLPLPPFMDPLVLEARQRNRTPKPEQDEASLTEFQKEFATNAYALALATPMRQCAITRARLPLHFLQRFSTIYQDHPTTPNALNAAPAAAKLKASLVHTPPRIYSNESGSGIGSYVLNSREVLEDLGAKRKWMALVNLRMQKDFARRARRRPDNISIKKEWEWDPDMPLKVLRNMQVAAIQRLIAIFESGDDALMPVREGVQISPDTGLVIQLGESGVGDELNLCGSTFYHLRDLLGIDFDEFLNIKAKEASIWALRRSTQTAQLQTAFERIRGYTNQQLRG